MHECRPSLAWNRTGNPPDLFWMHPFESMNLCSRYNITTIQNFKTKYLQGSIKKDLCGAWENEVMAEHMIQFVAEGGPLQDIHTLSVIPVILFLVMSGACWGSQWQLWQDQLEAFLFETVFLPLSFRPRKKKRFSDWLYDSIVTFKLRSRIEYHLLYRNWSRCGWCGDIRSFLQGAPLSRCYRSTAEEVTQVAAYLWWWRFPWEEA